MHVCMRVVVEALLTSLPSFAASCLVLSYDKATSPKLLKQKTNSAQRMRSNSRPSQLKSSAYKKLPCIESRHHSAARGRHTGAFSAMYLACRLYTKGTQTRSPKANMYPKPSDVMSMVERIEGSNHSPSTTYKSWNAFISIISMLTCTQLTLLTVGTENLGRMACHTCV
jgi:hypothetical protein